MDAVLHAYDAMNLSTELWNSSVGTGLAQLGSRP